MIHSCAGGIVRDKKTFDFAKVEILSSGQKLWYISSIPMLTVGDVVVVPFGSEGKKERARVIRLDKNVAEGCTPISIKYAKEIEKVEN